MTSQDGRPIGRMTKRLILTLTIMSGFFLMTVAGPAHSVPYDWPGMKKCGSFQAQYKIWVYAKHIKCRRARRIQKEYWLAPDSRKTFHNGGSGAYGWVTLKRYPRWRCTSGAGGGNCSLGKKRASYQN